MLQLGLECVMDFVEGRFTLQPRLGDRARWKALRR